MAHDVSLTYSRFEHMPPAALALTALLHVGVGLALYWISPLRHVDPFEDAIEVSMEAPAPQPPIPEAKPEAPPVAPPAPPPAASVPPPQPPRPQAATPTPQPTPAAPPMRLGLPPPAAEPSTNPRDVAGAETPAKQATDIPTPDRTPQDGQKEEVKKEPPQEALQEPKPEPKPEPQPEPRRVEPEPPQQQAMARPEPTPPPPPPPPPSLEQALPPLEAPPPPVTERDVPKPLPVPRPAPPPPQQAVRPPPPPPPAPRPAPQPPAQTQQPPRPSPLAAPPQRGAESQSAARQSSPTFQNPADNYGQKRAKEQYAWQVERRLAQFPYVPKEAGPIRQAGSLLLRLTVSREGRLIDVVLERSSGLASLDAGVIETLRRASPYPPVPSDIPGDRYTFQLPVNFNYNQNR